MAYFTTSAYHKYIELQNVSGSGDPADAPVGGIYLFASGTSEDAGASRLYLQNQGGSVTDLAKAVDIDAFAALGGTGLHQTQDHFLFSDNGTEKKISFSNLQDAVFADVSGDATIAAGGALTLAANSVSQAQLDDDAVGADELAANAVVNASIASNAAIDMDKLDGGSLASSLSDLAQGDLMYAGDVDDSNNLKSITFSNLEDAIFGNVSGDATIAAGGVMTLANNSVSQAQLDDDAVGADELAANAVVEASIVDNAVTLAKMAGITRGSVIIGDASGDPSLLAKGTSGQFLQSDGTDPSYVTMSGDVASLASGGAVTLAAAQTNITSILATDLKIGEDDQTKIDFETADEIHFYAANAEQVYVADGVFGPQTDTDVDLGADGVAFKKLFVDDIDLNGQGRIDLDADADTSIRSAADDQIQFELGGSDRVTFTANGIGVGAGAGAGGSNLGVDGSITMDGALSVGGGYSDGGSGLSVSAAGALQFNGALTVGSSGEGVDATFHGGAANEAFIYDASENHIKIQDSSSNTLVTMGGDATSDYGVDVGGGSAGTNNINKVRASAFVTFSDESLKKDIEQMNGALDTVMSLKGVEFTWKNSDARDFGFIAQEVQEVLPQAVHENAGVHGVDYSRLTSVLVEAVKAQQIQIEELKAILKK